MNDLPINWAETLQEAYPKRSGPSGWGGMKLLLELRRALRESNWETIIHGCENYKAYCQASGKEGTDYVQAPLRFIADGCYLEEFSYTAVQTKEEGARAEIKRKEGDRWVAAERAGALVGVQRYPADTVSSFETRIMLAKAGMGGGVPVRGHGGDPALEAGERSGRVATDITARVSSLTNRMRIAK